MPFHLPGADRVDIGTLFALVLLPAAMGVAAAAGIVLTAPQTLDGLSAAAFAATLVKLCYLGTAAAHVGRFIMEATDGGPGHPAWWAGDHDDLPAPRPDADALARWRLFPNALDSALLAFGLTAAVNALVRVLG